MLAGTTKRRDLTNKQFATLALLQAHIAANGNYYDWGSNFTVYADATSANNGEYKLTYNESTTSKLDSDNLVKYIPGGSPATWGSITGTLSDQTDLQNELNTAAGSATWGSITGTLADQTDLQSALDSKWKADGNFSLSAVVQVDTAGFSLRTGTANVHMFVNQNMTQMKSSSAGSTSIRYLIEMNRNAGVGIKIADNLDNIGLRYEADYSANLDDLTVPNWGHVRQTLGGETFTPPTNTEDGQSIRWNDTGQAWEYFTPSSGITNSAASNELMKSDGTNAVASGLYSTASGNLVLGSTADSNGRTLTTDGLNAEIPLTIEPKGKTNLNLESKYTSVGTDTGFSSTNTTEVIGEFFRGTSGVPAAGIGFKLLLNPVSLGGYLQSNYLEVKYNVVTDTAEEVEYNFYGAIAGLSTKMMQIGKNIRLNIPSGNFFIDNLPTADPGVSGAWWNDAGTVKISA